MSRWNLTSRWPLSITPSFRPSLWVTARWFTPGPLGAGTVGRSCSQGSGSLIYSRIGSEGVEPRQRVPRGRGAVTRPLSFSGSHKLAQHCRSLLRLCPFATLTPHPKRLGPCPHSAWLEAQQAAGNVVVNALSGITGRPNGLLGSCQWTEKQTPHVSWHQQQAAYSCCVDKIDSEF